jgi:hypothetical protein
MVALCVPICEWKSRAMHLDKNGKKTLADNIPELVVDIPFRISIVDVSGSSNPSIFACASTQGLQLWNPVHVDFDGVLGGFCLPLGRI